MLPVALRETPPPFPFEVLLELRSRAEIPALEVRALFPPIAPEAFKAPAVKGPALLLRAIAPDVPAADESIAPAATVFPSTRMFPPFEVILPVRTSRLACRFTLPPSVLKLPSKRTFPALISAPKAAVLSPPPRAESRALTLKLPAAIVEAAVTLAASAESWPNL